MCEYEISCKDRQNEFLEKLSDLIELYEFENDIFKHSVHCEITLCGIKYIYDDLGFREVSNILYGREPMEGSK